MKLSALRTERRAALNAVNESRPRRNISPTLRSQKTVLQDEVISSGYVSRKERGGEKRTPRRGSNEIRSDASRQQFLAASISTVHHHAAKRVMGEDVVTGIWSGMVTTRLGRRLYYRSRIQVT